MSGNTTTQNIFSTVGWSHTSQAIYQSDPDTLELANLITGDIITIPSPDGYLVDIDWSPDDQWVLLSFREDNSQRYGELWLYSVVDDTMTLMHDTASIVSTESLLFRLFCAISMWSPDAKYFTFATNDNQQVNVDIEILSLNAIPLPSSDTIHIREWTVNHRLVIFADSDETSLVLYTYDVDNDTLTEWNRIDYFYQDAFLSISADSRYIVHTSQNEEYFYSVDTHSGDVHHIELLPQDYFIGPAEMVWHPSENWLFLYGLGQGTRTIFVSNPDGTVQRKLGLCINMGSCFGWLPPVTD